VSDKGCEFCASALRRHRIESLLDHRLDEGGGVIEGKVLELMGIPYLSAQASLGLYSQEVQVRGVRLPRWRV
jgi:hypothetical protein